jgi:hypothetical protein
VPPRIPVASATLHIVRIDLGNEQSKQVADALALRGGNDLAGRWCGAGAGLVGHVSGLKVLCSAAWRLFRRLNKKSSGFGLVGRVRGADRRLICPQKKC